MAGKGTRVEIEGIVPLARALRKAGDEGSRDMLLAANKEAASIVAAAAAPLIPYRTGKLSGTLRSAGTAKGGAVLVGKAKVPYAGPIHFGWYRRRISPQPFLYQAMDRKAGDVEAIYLRRLDELLQRVVDEANA